MALFLRVAVTLLLGALLSEAAPACAQTRRSERAGHGPVVAAHGSREGGSSSWLDDELPRSKPPATFRTICVRTCDGYYFPVSFQTTRLGLEVDAQRCKKKCGQGAALFFHANPGGDVASARTFTGLIYEALPNAFRYLKQRVPGCACSPEPWTAEEQRRHRAYADEERQIAKDAPALPTAGASESLDGPQRPLAELRRAPASGADAPASSAAQHEQRIVDRTDAGEATARN